MSYDFLPLQLHSQFLTTRGGGGKKLFRGGKGRAGKTREGNGIKRGWENFGGGGSGEGI